MKFLVNVEDTTLKTWLGELSLRDVTTTTTLEIVEHTRGPVVGLKPMQSKPRTNHQQLQRQTFASECGMSPSMNDHHFSTSASITLTPMDLLYILQPTFPLLLTHSFYRTKHISSLDSGLCSILEWEAVAWVYSIAQKRNIYLYLVSHY